jgi:pimeloyl-ACP methyl ester carboxylesterase
VSELIEPFEIRVDDAILADLHDRLTRTRFPDQIAGTGWEYGMPAPSLREFVDYWRDTYDWRAREARLNGLEHFRTTIDGQAIHFVHARSTDENATPLLLVHGWPGSIIEFVDAIPLLTTPGPGACHVVAPSLPGYGFSEPTRTPGWDPKRIARAFATLMQRLGYAHYGAQGGDWGAQVTTRLAALDAEHCIGLHCNMPLAEPPKDRPELSEKEQAELAAFSQFRQNESAYAMEQSTKPQTLGAALNDSPAGLLAWIVEKFRAWSDCDGDPLNVFTRDQLIDNVMLYWVTATATSSVRLYWEHAHNPDPPEFVAVPTAIARFPREPLRFPRSWVERHYNVVRWTDMPCGGHFAAMEQPQLFADDVRSFFATLPSPA